MQRFETSTLFFEILPSSIWISPGRPRERPTTQFDIECFVKRKRQISAK